MKRFLVCALFMSNLFSAEPPNPLNLGSLAKDPKPWFLVEKGNLGDPSQWVVQETQGNRKPGGPDPFVRFGPEGLSFLNHGGISVWWRTRLTVPVAITYRATVKSALNFPGQIRVRDLNCFFLADEIEKPGGVLDSTRYTGVFGDYHGMRGWYASSGGGPGFENANTTTRFRLYPRKASGKNIRHATLFDKDGRSAYMLTPDREMEIVWIALADRAQYLVDGHLVYEMCAGEKVISRVGDEEPLEENLDPAKYPLPTSGYFAFRSVASHQHFRDFGVWKPVGK